MIYIDTSSAFKVLLPEVGDLAVEQAVASENEVVVSPITELELRIQIRARLLGGSLRSRVHDLLLDRMVVLFSASPFRRRTLCDSLLTTAIHQHERSSINCRSLDRLHLAAMEELGIRRLMTHDRRQAEAARALGYEVISP